MHLEPWQWAVAILGALLIGLSKTGIAGIGTFAVAVFALIYHQNGLPVQASAGAVLPILIAADVVAVKAYHRHAVWSHLVRLMPWAVAGILLGFGALAVLDTLPDKAAANKAISLLISGILVLMVVLQLWKSRGKNVPDSPEDVPHSIWFIATMGLLAGFTTMVANAAGPIMIMYLLAMRLPKMEFIGTGAWYFLILNCFKVPFSYKLGYITAPSLHLDLVLIPFAIIGALFGRYIIRFIDQKLFENLALIFTVIAALKLLFS
jgi:uncharacterized membrane protein YfcA